MSFFARLLFGATTVFVLASTRTRAQSADESYSFITLAGIPNPLGGSTDGPGSVARFFRPWGVALNSDGVIYVADTENHTIRKVTPEGVVTTLAGLVAGSHDGTGSDALFRSPRGVAVDNAGNVYVTDAGNSTIRKVTPEGAVTTLAGMAITYGSVDGTGTDARFNSSEGLAADKAGNLYVADSYTTIRKVTPEGVVTTLAGLAGKSGSADGTGRDAQFGDLWGVAVDNTGNIYVADTANSTIRKVTPVGVVTTLAGLAGKLGSTDGIGSDARFYRPGPVAVDGSGNVYVGEPYIGTVRRITPAGVVTTLARLAFEFSGDLDGTGSDVRFAGDSLSLFVIQIPGPFGLAVDSVGNLYVTDGNDMIRKGFVRPVFLTRNLGVTDGKFNVDLTGQTEQSVVIESSDDLKNWLTVWTGAFTGVLHFTDLKSTTESNRFYRARLP